MAYLIGLDIGTSGVKGVVIAEDGNPIGAGTSSYPLSTPRPGWAEQDPADWWRATREVLATLIGAVNPAEIRGLGLSGQMHSAVCLDERMEVIRPAILWCDTRTSAQCREILDLTGGLAGLIDHVANPALEGFTAPKILWLRENEPANHARIRLVLLPKDYIRYKLTGEIQTEVSDAAGTLLFDVRKKEWSETILAALDLPRRILPPVVESTTIVGGITGEVAAETGLAPGTPVVAGGADNACGAVGAGIVEEGRVLASIGSSGVVLAQTDSPVADDGGRIHLFNHAQSGSWYMMGVMLSAGVSFSWLKEKLFAESLDYAALNELAAGTPPGANGLVFLPYLYGERTPHADADARGVFFGISGRHDRGHFARGVMEGVCFALRDSLELIASQGVKIREVRAIGGGARSKVWQRILADVFGREISLLRAEEGPAYGAAIIAGVGAGVYRSFADAERRIIEIAAKVAPDAGNIRRYNEQYRLFRQLYPSLKERFKELSALENASR